jgi:hypothetical protein
MMSNQLQTANHKLHETTQFVFRALRDFGLMDAFESLSAQEKGRLLRWIDAARSEQAQEERVSDALDCLAFNQSPSALYSKRSSREKTYAGS